MDFRPREAPFFGDYFFRFGPIAFKFSHTSFGSIIFITLMQNRQQHFRARPAGRPAGRWPSLECVANNDNVGPLTWR